MLRDLLERVEPPPHLPDPQRRAIDIAIRNAYPEGPSPDPLSIAVATTVVLRHLAAQRLLVAIDDAQWMDEPSAYTLRYALRRLRGHVGVLVTLRGPGDTDSLALAEAFGERLTSIHLGPLTMSELFRLLQARTGTSFSRPLLSRIEAVSEGNPFFALELGRAVIRADRVPELGEDLPVPDTLAELVESRLQALPESASLVLGAAALASEPKISTVAEALGIDAADAIAPALDAEIARIRDGEIVFEHPLLAAGVLARLDEVARRDIHARLAIAETDAEARARHLARCASTPNPQLARTLEEAAIAAQDRGALGTAAELLALAVDTTPDGDRTDSRRRRNELAAARFSIGDIVGAAAILDELLDESPSGPERARALLLLAKVRFEQRSAVEAITLCEQAIVEAGDIVALLAPIYADATQFCDFDMERRGRYARSSWETLSAQTDPEPEALAIALTALTVAELCLGNGLRQDLIARAIEIEETHAPAIVSRRASMNLGEFYTKCDMPELARPLLEDILEASRRSDDSSLCEALWAIADLDLVTGRWERAGEELREALDVAQGDEQPTKALEALALLAPLEAATGHPVEADAHADLALDIASGLDAPVPTLLSAIMRGMIAVHVGDAKAAVEHLSLADREDEHEHMREPGFRRYMDDLSEALIETGRVDEADDVLMRLETMGRAVDRPSALAGAARGRASLAASRGDLSAALDACATARAFHERAADPFELGRSLLTEGKIRRRSRQKREARAVLEQATEIFARLAAEPWVVRATAELDRVGGRVEAPSELTETERRIANLAAQGQTNKEIAATLFISARTVEANLTRIYRKLRVPSRAALGQRLVVVDSPDHAETPDSGSRASA